jgi:hypothetical protein
MYLPQTDQLVNRHLADDLFGVVVAVFLLARNLRICR